MKNPMNEILFLCRNNYVFISVLFYSNFLYFKPLFAGDDGKKCSKGGSWSDLFMEGNSRKFWTT